MYNEHTYLPIDNLVLVELDVKPEDEVKIVRLEGHDLDTEQLGTVIRTGRGYNTIAGLVPCNVKPNERVLLRKGSGNVLEHLPSNFIVIKDANLMGKIGPEPVAITPGKIISIKKKTKSK